MQKLRLPEGLDANAGDRRWLEVAKRVLIQKKGDSQKVYSLHEPEVYCLSKGKEHKKYEFGAKASLVIGKTHGVILGAYSLPENDYDGHTLDPALKQVERIAKYRPEVAFRRRAAIEPRIEDLKSDFRLGRNFLKRQKGDAINLLDEMSLKYFLKIDSFSCFYLRADTK